MIRALAAALVALSLLPSVHAATVQKVGPLRQATPLFKGCCGWEVSMASDGSSVAVFWKSGTEILARRLNAAGEPFGEPVPIPESASTSPGDAVSDGNGFLLLGRSDLTAAAERIEAYRLTSDFRVIGTKVDLLPGAPLDLIFDGVDYVLASTDGGKLFLSRVSRDGRVLASVQVPDAYPSSIGASIAWNGSEYVLAWMNGVRIDCLNCYTSTYVRVVSFNSRLELSPSRELGAGSFASVVWTGTSFVAVWTDMERILAARFDPATPAQSPIEVAFHPTRYLILLSSTAIWNGRTISVVFTSGFEDSALYALQLDASGRRVDDAIVRLPGYFNAPTVAHTGRPGSSVLAYIQLIPEPRMYSIFAGTVATDPAPKIRRAVRR